MYYKTIWINGKQKRLHRYIMECYLGRELKSNELVHHKNHNNLDNNIKNLELTTRCEHAKKHNLGNSGTQFLQKYYLDKREITKLYQNYGMEYIANLKGCSVGVIHKFIKENNIKYLMTCKICGSKVKYRKKQLCRKHYFQKYYQEHGKSNKSDSL